MSNKAGGPGDGDKKGVTDGASVSFAPDTHDPADPNSKQLNRKESRKKLEHAPVRLGYIAVCQ